MERECAWGKPGHAGVLSRKTIPVGGDSHNALVLHVHAPNVSRFEATRFAARKERPKIHVLTT